MKILIASLSLFVLNAFAVDNLSDMKRTATESIGRDISNLEGNRSCIENASTVEAFKACKYHLGTDMSPQKQQEKTIDDVDKGLGKDLMKK
jgi:hypothetical protein